ncbi:MAG TPA: alpha/beta fold hydrolase, partial [Kofleriaceae bacterium]|nr:alpha/beta fold hydrolase [Kofleriaceae bacterium]
VPLWRRRTAAPESLVAVEPPLEGVTPVPGKREHGPPLPVVLVHGLFGFDRIGIPGARFDYFRGIAKHLESLGCHAHAVRLPAAASVPDRARELVSAIESLPHERIDLIAHSLGGLDARYALSHLGLARRVRSLVTVGTPHRGSPLADLALKGPLDWARRIVSALGVPLEALEWLSTDALAAFNAQVLDAPGVRYACVVGGMHREDSYVPLALVPAHAYLRRVAGPNDGIVPIASQYWGETLAEIEADHFAQVGWRVAMRATFDAPGLYAFVVARLGDAPPAALRSAARRAETAELVQ